MVVRQPKVRAPELTGRSWINTGGTPLTLAGLRGRIVLLDFWTFCCINCLHVLDELREIEQVYADVLVIVGVHSPKFVHEADHDALVAACERYEVHHPVLDDPELSTWRQYAVRAWPTLSLVDPEGYVVAQLAGEGHAAGLRSHLDALIAEHDAKGTLHRGDGPYVPPEPAPTELRFPGKVLALGGPDRAETYLVSDSQHHALAELAADGETVLRRIGTGVRGLADGKADGAAFREPQGLCLLPAEIAARAGYEVVVADTVNHALRGVRLDTGEVVTVAGTGRQWWQGSATRGRAREMGLSSPWDVAWYDGRIVVAMAGIHQLWEFDPVAGTAGVYAGTTNEGLADGPLAEAWFAQPSGLAVSPDGGTLWIADSETSALRYVRDGVVHTAVGTGLFDFGLRDGAGAQALLQHPLGVTVLPDGSVAVADTYNGAVRRYDPISDEVTTLATGLREPSDALFTSGAGGSHLLVVESAAHRLVRLRLPEQAVRTAGSVYRTRRPVTDVAPGPLDLDVVFQPPPGQKLDERYGPATRLVVSASPPELLVSGAGRDTALRRELVLAAGVPEGVLHVSAMAASCDTAVGEGAACHVHQQDWGIPVRVTPGAASRLPLMLSGLDEG